MFKNCMIAFFCGTSSAYKIQKRNILKQNYHSFTLKFHITQQNWQNCQLHYFHKFESLMHFWCITYISNFSWLKFLHHIEISLIGMSFFIYNYIHYHFKRIDICTLIKGHFIMQTDAKWSSNRKPVLQYWVFFLKIEWFKSLESQSPLCGVQAPVLRFSLPACTRLEFKLCDKCN